MMTCYAHTLENEPPDRWEPLEKHLRDVSQLASEFAAKFGAADWGRLAGLWHDLGKYSAEFQDYLRTQNGLEAHLEQRPGRRDHSTAGAQHAHQSVKLWGRLLAYCIAGHHAGLADAAIQLSSLDARLKKQVDAYGDAPTEYLSPGIKLPPPSISGDGAAEDRIAFQLALFTRMVFSCLVDSDFLATEAFMDTEKSAQRPAADNQLPSMKSELDRHLAALAVRAESCAGNRDVFECRQEVLAACRAAAARSPELFSMTVPTGGGKTLASLAFALGHATRHDLNRIIYAIPFTSIIEQTADVFRDVYRNLRSDVVLEHHSNLDPDANGETRRSRLAAENWDAPLIVTTNVQLFESLFASRTSRCRKLHNLVGSVIILDEAQTLPVELLRPVLAVLRELVADYHCTVVLCTATQPALTHRDEFPIGLEDVHEIIEQPARLYERMRRVEVKQLGRITDDDLIQRLDDTASFLTIVSTLMCGAHRAAQLTAIRRRLKDQLPCRVISTQLVEAGVDVDFPVVYRAATGLDSLAQAAGRCNREGTHERGIVYLFDPIDCRPFGYLGSIASTAAEVIPDHADLLSPAAIEQYFRLHYWKRAGENRWDDRRVMDCFPTPAQDFAFDFRTAAERFRMIEDTTKPILVPFGEGRRWIEQLRVNGPHRKLLRRLQRYTVGVYEQSYAQLVGRDVEEFADGGYAVLINEDLYDEQLGLRVDRPGFQEPESLIS
jgi:CRISPR-associated endonuclease/helicase Cas3